jgi:aspartate/methionine/tyrosine aminotransferase
MDMLLSKPVLPPGYLDTSVGEPHIVRHHLMQTFDISEYHLPQETHMWEYPPPNGHKPLVDLLERKYKAQVIITNGAKQALGACFYALKQMGKERVGMKLPYWALLPQLAKMHDMECSFADPDINFTKLNAQPDCKELRLPQWHDAYLLLAPNNPCGHCDSPNQLIHTAKEYKDKGIPFIHDAAYYTHTYLPFVHTLPPIGDVQIYSISKMLGLSGLRLGFVVCPNPEFYKLILNYMEHMTVGVSITSQMFLYSLMDRMENYPSLTGRFEGLSSLALDTAKAIIKQVNPEILEVGDVEKTNGMFGWFKVGPKADFDKAKINVVGGELFGMPGYIRMNLAFSVDQMRDIVQRLNSVI